MSATSPVLVDVRPWADALRIVWAAARDREDDPRAPRPVVAMAGTLLSAGGPDFGVLVTCPGLDLPAATVDVERLLNVVSRAIGPYSATVTPTADVWTTDTHLVIHAHESTWRLPLQDPPSTIAELWPAEDDQRFTVEQGRLELGQAMALAATNTDPHRRPIYDAVHLTTRGGDLVVEVVAGPLAAEFTIEPAPRPDIDVLLTPMLVDVWTSRSMVNPVTVTRSHALVGAGTRPATVIDAALAHGSTVTVWNLTPDGPFPPLDQLLHPRREPTWTHSQSGPVLSRALADVAAAAQGKTFVRITQTVTTDEGMVALVTADGDARAPLGRGYLDAPPPTVRLDLLTHAWWALADQSLTITGRGISDPIHLTSSWGRVAINPMNPPAHGRYY